MISIICVPFCAFLMKKRDRNHFRPPQDDPKAAASQSTSLEAVWHDPFGKRGSAQPLVVAFPGLHRLHQLHDLHHLCSILRIFDEQKGSKSFWCEVLIPLNRILSRFLLTWFHDRLILPRLLHLMFRSNLTRSVGRADSF